MNMKKAVFLLFGVLGGLILSNMFTDRNFDGSQLLLTLTGGIFGYGIVVLFIWKRQGKRN
ncbi:hypothetical protein [Halobacillus trueperi]|uniref:hypothetical protein n=1 Tax=Halobacillus trueperi TaxID=156205 RepID=UPI003735E52A